jgi:hypothetical protein
MSDTGALAVLENAMRPLLAALIAAPLLAACAAPTPPVDRQAAAAGMVGQSEVDLVRQMGVPTRSFDSDGRRYVAYLERRVNVTQGSGVWAPFWKHWVGGYGPDVAPEVVDYTCETTFEIDGGKVRWFTLRGNACT